MPRVNDGALLFLQTMLTRMAPPEKGGSRIAIISTYVWLLRNDKPANDKGRVMLIDARQQFENEPKSFGNKRHRITDPPRLDRGALHQWLGWGYDDVQVKIFPHEDFADNKVRVAF
jgi:type I restriction enzyme M protein